MNVQQQENGSDCGVYAIAFAKSILEGKNPTELHFSDPRQHLASHLVKGNIPSFPSISARRTPEIRD